MDSLDIEKKYIEERIKVLRALEKNFGKKIIDMSADAKKKLIYKRVKEQYKTIIPVNMDQFFKIIFNSFSNILE